jgi:hypothetical protein
VTFVREYVEKGMNEEGRNPLGDVYGGVILGRKDLIKQALGTLREDALDEEEIALEAGTAQVRNGGCDRCCLLLFQSPG